MANKDRITACLSDKISVPKIINSNIYIVSYKWGEISREKLIVASCFDHAIYVFKQSAIGESELLSCEIKHQDVYIQS